MVMFTVHISFHDNVASTVTSRLSLCSFIPDENMLLLEAHPVSVTSAQEMTPSGRKVKKNTVLHQRVKNSVLHFVIISFLLVPLIFFTSNFYTFLNNMNTFNVFFH